MNNTKKSLQESKVIYEHIGKVRRYIKTVLSYAFEQPIDMPMTIHLGDCVTTLPAEDMITLLELVDNDVYGLQIMYEIEMMMAEEFAADEDDDHKLLLPPRQSLTITDNDRFRAEGEFIDIVMNIFFEWLQEQNNREGIDQ